MDNQKYQFPCGVLDDDVITWKSEIACYMVGCKDCRFFNGNEYYVRNFQKGVSMWAKHEISEMNKEG
jgi:hypothetical protein